MVQTELLLSDIIRFKILNRSLRQRIDTLENKIHSYINSLPELQRYALKQYDYSYDVKNWKNMIKEYNLQMIKNGDRIMFLRDQMRKEKL